MAHRPTKTMLRLRREKVHRLRSQQYTADEIYNGLKDEFQHITLATIYSDIKYLKEYSKAYIVLEYIPNFGDEVAQAKTLIDWALGEAVTTYHNGREEIHNITLPDGKKMAKHIRKLRDLRALALIAQIAVLKVKFGYDASVVASVNRIVEENRRLQGAMTQAVQHDYGQSITPFTANQQYHKSPMLMCMNSSCGHPQSCSHTFDDGGFCVRCGHYDRKYDTNAVF